MKGKVFIDTNIFVYSIDKHDKVKQKKVRTVLTELAAKGIGVISTQVLQEFYVASTKKLNANPLVVKEILHSLEKFEVVQISPDMINDAIEVSLLNKISFWDSLIVVAAEVSKCTSLITEDLNSGQVIKGVTVVNPFV